MIADPPLVLRFATGRIGCLLPVLTLGTIGFGWWSVRPDQLPANGRYDQLIELARSMTVGGINVPFLIVAGIMLWQLHRFGMRWADGVAVAADPDGLVFHWTLLRRRRVPWAEIGSVEYRVTTRQHTRVPEIIVALAGRTLSIRGFHDENGAGRALVAEIERRLAQGSRSAGATDR